MHPNRSLRNSCSQVLFLVVVSLALRANAQTENILYRFTDGNDGGEPTSDLKFDAAGNLYGTTLYGGGSGCTFNCGVVFRLSPNGDGTWTENALHAFPGGAAGNEPSFGVTLDAFNNVYGATDAGGSKSCRYDFCGVAFQLTPASNGPWEETVIQNFVGLNTGTAPNGNFIFDSDGNLYGTTYYELYSGGVAFELSPAASGLWTETILHKFADTPDGAGPLAGLIRDSAGNFYGTTFGGGEFGTGTVFELSKSGGEWSEKILYSFGKESGYSLYAPLVMDASGNLYGTTMAGGRRGNKQCPNGGCGVVFELTPTSSGQWQEAVLYAFSGLSDGGSPRGGVILDPAGNVYGTTEYGGRFAGGLGFGVVFKLSHTATGWKEMVLHTFTGVPDGALPIASLTLDAAGNLYGTTTQGGRSGCESSNGCGTVFEITP
ncbi:MAG: choice-of-anchor tandem repeat GloVer-containing protein [Candidatus Sulfotelmatobacter sp.]